MTGSQLLVGRCKTTLWADMAHPDPKPYELELAAVDACKPDDVLIAVAGGSTRSGIWGELLTTAAHNQGCVGAIIDALERMRHGECVIDPTIIATLLSRRRPLGQLETLSAREYEVLQLMAEGLTNRSIAERLVVGERTVAGHVADVFAKFGLDDDFAGNRRVLAVLRFLQRR